MDAASIEKATKPPKLGKKLALIGGALLGVAMLAAIIISLKTKDGTLIVEVDQPGATVQVDEKDTVHITQAGDKGTVSISVEPGKHRLKIEKDGFAVFGKEFEMKAGGKTPIKAELVPLDEKPAMVGKKSAEHEGEKKSLFFQTSGYEPWAKEVAAMSAEEQVDAVSKKLVELNPKFDGKVERNVENGVVISFHFFNDNVTDISPVRALGGLKVLYCGGGGHASGKLSDLSPLHGMRLTILNFLNTQVSDLSPLKDMPLEILHCGNTPVSSLSSLNRATLTSLDCSGTKVSDLSPMQGSKLVDLNCAATNVSDLSPLLEMPLKRLNFAATKVAKLPPMKGMPLLHLYVNETLISDLSPLEAMNLNDILLTPKNITSGLDVIRQMQSLKVIGVHPDKFWPSDEFWKKFDAGEFGKPTSTKSITDINTPAFQQWMKDVQAMPAEKQVEGVSKKLVELNPGFDGKLNGPLGQGTPKIENGIITELGFLTDDVTDISPVRALLGLKSLWCACSVPEKGRFSDLSPLQGMPLTYLNCQNTNVSDLSPLHDMPLTSLTLYATQVSDLSPLQGMPLTHLYCSLTKVSELTPLHGMPLGLLSCSRTKVSDLSPLKGLPLIRLECSSTNIIDISPLKGMSLVYLSCDYTKVFDLSPLEGMPLIELVIVDSKVSDLTPLSGMNLTEILFTPQKITNGIEIIRQMKSLKSLGTSWTAMWPPDEFWKKYDAGEFAKPQ